MEIRRVPIESIHHRQDARPRSDGALADLASSIDKIGLINPIRVRIVGDEYEVIAGSHRLQAVDSLGWREVPCIVTADDDIAAELAMIDENLCRAELSPADRAKQTARRKAIYLELHPETAHGGDRKSDQVDKLSIRSFADETAAITGTVARTVRRDAERGEKVIDEVLDMIRGTKLDTGTYLDKIKRLPPNEQVAAAKRDLAMDAKQAREAANAEKVATKAKSHAEQAENDAIRDQTREALSPEVQAQQQAKAEAITARKAEPADIEALTAEIEELREANTALEEDVARLTAENKLYNEMRVQFEQGGFDKVIAGKDKVIQGLETRVYRESADKSSWMRKAKMWQAEAIKLGYSRNVEIDIETGEVING